MDSAEKRRKRQAAAGNGQMTCSEAGKKGGEAVKAKYGIGYYEELGKKGGKVTRERHGPEFYEEIGRRGGSVKGKSK
jgi:general stress protein YciG